MSLPVSEFPPALAEKNFVIPGPGDESLLCGEARRNLTDQQETSQWLGGVGVPKAILNSLLSTSLCCCTTVWMLWWKEFLSEFEMLSQECYVLFFQGGLKKNHGTVVVHPTAYDGCVELAALQLGHPVCGSSLMDASYKCAKEIVKNHLLQASLKHPKVLISVVLQ